MKLDKLSGKGLEYLYRDPRSQIIYFRRYTKKTGEILKSLRTRDIADAKLERDALVTGVSSKAARVKAQRVLALELFDKWVARKETLGASKNTLTSIQATRKFLAKFFDTMTADEITAEWWESEYIPQVKKLTGNPKRKFFNDRKWLIAFLRQIKDDGKIEVMPSIKKVDPPTKVGKVFTSEEIERLLRLAHTEDLRLAVTMACTMGMRRGEIFALELSRINEKERTITLTADDTKTKRSRSFAISDAAWPMIAKRLKRGGRWLFESRINPGECVHKDGYMTAWRSLRRAAGVKGRFHDLRHTFLTNAFKDPTVNPALICYYAGLSMEVAERVYLHFTAEDTKGMRSIVSYSGQVPERGNVNG